MIENADKEGSLSTARDDPRITKIGKFLRKWKIDELPQLINVLRGEMSLVGPRPEVSEVIRLMTLKERRIIFSVKPGMCGTDTLFNMHEEEWLAGSEDPHKKYLEEIWPEKKRLQIAYVKNKSLVGDIKILTQTLWRICRK